MTDDKRPRIPRGLLQTGPVLLSYGFRPFFLGAGVWACAAMALWVAALAWGWPVGGGFGPVWWHGHEMVFGFAPAVLAGFLMTAVPNWTGRLPVSGRPLAVLAGVWLAGRLAMAGAGWTGTVAASAIDAAFLPMLLALMAREIVAGKKWKDLKVIGALGLVTAGNLWVHLDWHLGSGGEGMAFRGAVAGYVVLVMIIGGRILPAFTRNWLHMRGAKEFPVPHGRFDTGAIVMGAVALALWTAAPEGRLTLAAALLAAALHAVRLSRWRGLAAWPEPLLFVLHAAYAFMPAGFAMIALAAAGLVLPASALHVLTVGVIGCMMLAVMTRATRGHSGRPLTASRLTVAAYVCLFAAALLRPVADWAGEGWMQAAGLLWIAAFALFLAEYGPMLLRERRKPRHEG